MFNYKVVEDDLVYLQIKFHDFTIDGLWVMPVWMEESEISCCWKVELETEMIICVELRIWTWYVQN